MSDLGALGGEGSVGYALNKTGEVTGTSDINANGVAPLDHAFLWNGSTMTDIGALVSGGSSTGFGINTAGQIVGQASTSTGDEHAFWWNGHTMIDLGTLGGATSDAYAISDSGEIVGYSTLDNNGDTGAFLYENGTMYNLMNLLVPGSGITSLELAEGNVLSSNGKIVAEAQINNSGTYQMVILTPTPEPTGPLLLLLGAVTATLRQRRRSRRDAQRR